jgi:nitroreductase
MELLEALRTTGAARDFRDEPVTDEVLVRVLDTARFAPSGGNSQGWRVVVVKDPDKRRALRDLYLPGWYQYLAMSSAGLRPWSPVNDRDAETAALPAAETIRANAPADGFAETIDAAPALLALFVDLGALAAVDRDFDRYQFAGGASVYPFAWNLLLAGRSEGLGGVITTMCIREEPAMKALFAVPDRFALAAVIVLGYPVKQPSRLRRSPVEEFATVDTFNGSPLS